MAPSVAGFVPFAEEIPNKNWLNLIEVILMSSFNCHSKKKSILPTEAREIKTKKKQDISFEYWFTKATYVQHE